MKKFFGPGSSVLSLGFACGIAALLPALGSCSSIAANATYALPVTKAPYYDERPYGGFGFGAALDTAYTRFSFDYYPFVEKGQETEQALNFGYGFYLKYPIDLGKITLSPIAGYNMVVGGLAAGMDIDVPLSGNILFRAGTLYDFGPFTNIGEYSTLFFRTGIAYKFDIGRLKSASANQAQKPASEEVDKLVGKIAGLVFDAERSLGMTVDRLREYWRRAELIELSDMCSIIGYPDLVAVTMFFLTDGKVTNVTYSFGNYDAKVEAVLKLALIQRFDSPRSTGSDGRSYWVDRTTVFALGKEKYPEAESGYILTLVCFQP